MSSTQPILELKNVSKKYGDFHAASNIDLKIYSNEFLTLLGPSGSGKTTILQMIGGFTKLTEGQILLNGKNISNTPPNKRNMGFVFQDYALFPHMTVYSNIAYPLKIRKKSAAEINKAVNEVMELVQLKEFSTRKPSELSGGQQQRVALARALVFKPELILMDEPLGALDKKLREHVQLEIKKIQNILGVTIVFVTHDQEEALTMSDRIAVLNKSKLVQLGTPRELYEDPRNHFIADFIGQNNFIEGVVDKIDDTKVEIDIKLDEKITLKKEQISNKISANEKVMLAIRPEKMMIQKSSQGFASEGFSYNGKIKNKVYLGDSSKYIVSIENDGYEALELSVLSQSNNSMNIGEMVNISWTDKDINLLPD